MPKPRSRKYELHTLVAKNDLCQSWIATNVASGERCFVKVACRESPLGADVARSVLNDSFACQRKIRSGKVLTAYRKCREQGDFIVEYPYLDSTEWHALSPRFLTSHVQPILAEICLIVDYIHSLGLVHCDLKLANFMIHTRSEHPLIKLVDLDFLCVADSHPDARVIGTPAHIAPEISSNTAIKIQSDNYSLGISLSSVGQNRPVGVTLKPAILKEELFVVYLRQEVVYGEPTQSGCCTCNYRVTGSGLVVSADCS